jgi:hypothetical protein
MVVLRGSDDADFLSNERYRKNSGKRLTTAYLLWDLERFRLASAPVVSADGMGCANRHVEALPYNFLLEYTYIIVIPVIQTARRMADPILVGIYVAASVSQVVFMLLAVYYAFAITRTVGVFWAWTLMITAFVFFAARDVTSLASVLTTPAAELTSKTDQFTITSYWPGAILNELAYGTLAASTYGLRKIFRKTPSKKQPMRVAARTS